jgi:hypothetical protein
MMTGEFIDMVDGVDDARRGLQSAQASERDAEACRLQRLVRELHSATWPTRIAVKDHLRSVRVMSAAVEELAK